jgi:hypothetical protein
MDDNRINAALREGEDAFWEVVAARFPEAKTGDLAPDVAFALTRSMEQAIREWVSANVILKDDGETLKL